MKIGDRVRVGIHRGTLSEPTEELIAKREVLRTRPKEFWCIKFDGAGPYGDGWGVYHHSSYQVCRLRER